MMLAKSRTNLDTRKLKKEIPVEHKIYPDGRIEVISWDQPKHDEFQKRLDSGEFDFNG